MSATPVITPVTHALAHLGSTYTPLHHGGDAHSALWWISFLAVVVTGLVAAMVVCIVLAVRAAQVTAADVEARAARRSAGRRRAGA